MNGLPFEPVSRSTRDFRTKVARHPITNLMPDMFLHIQPGLVSRQVIYLKPMIRINNLFFPILPCTIWREQLKVIDIHFEFYNGEGFIISLVLLSLDANKKTAILNQKHIAVSK
jgi:hypothetical protein